MRTNYVTSTLKFAYYLSIYSVLFSEAQAYKTDDSALQTLNQNATGHRVKRDAEPKSSCTCQAKDCKCCVSFVDLPVFGTQEVCLLFLIRPGDPASMQVKLTLVEMKMPLLTFNLTDGLQETYCTPTTIAAFCIKLESYSWSGDLMHFCAKVKFAVIFAEVMEITLPCLTQVEGRSIQVDDDKHVCRGAH